MWRSVPMRAAMPDVLGSLAALALGSGRRPELRRHSAELGRRIAEALPRRARPPHATRPVRGQPWPRRGRRLRLVWRAAGLGRSSREMVAAQQAQEREVGAPPPGDMAAEGALLNRLDAWLFRFFN